MPYLACPGCGVRQYTPPLRVRRRACPVCETELLAASLRPPGADDRERARLTAYLEQLIGDAEQAAALADDVLSARDEPSSDAPSPAAALYRRLHRRVRELGDVTPSADRAGLAGDLLALNLDQRAALLLRTAVGLSREEIAHALDLPDADVRELLVVARVALAEARCGT